MNEHSDGIPVLTEIVTEEPPASTATPDRTLQFLGELEAHLTAVIQEHADELVHNACREMEALLLEQVSDRLKAELPAMIAEVIGAHFRGTGGSN
jgi:uncharacterized protein (DUF2267 family)